MASMLMPRAKISKILENTEGIKMDRVAITPAKPNERAPKEEKSGEINPNSSKGVGDCDTNK
jgi:hypothetical protein